MGDASSAVDGVLSRLESILRYIAPGFVMVLVTAIVIPESRPSIFFKDLELSLWVLLAAAVVGVALYSLHTGVIVRGFWYPIVKIHKSKLTGKTWNDMFELDSQRWLRRVGQDSEAKAIQNEIDKWAAMLNFLYCSSYPMIFVPIYRKYLQQCSLGTNGNLVLFVGITVLLCALISDFRITNREIWATKRYPDGKKI